MPVTMCDIKVSGIQESKKSVPKRDTILCGCELCRCLTPPKKKSKTVVYQLLKNSLDINHKQVEIKNISQ